jgi:hypothetical protein
MLFSLILMQYYGVFLKKKDFFGDKLLIFDWADVATLRSKVVNLLGFNCVLH